MFHHPLPSSAPLYSLVELSRFMISPARIAMKTKQDLLESPLHILNHHPLGKPFGASLELMERITRHYDKPEWNIHQAEVDGKPYKIKEVRVIKKTFGNLLHFQKASMLNQPKILIVAPLSGHYPTLVRGTVEAMLPYYDVYVTEWLNCRDIPLSKGTFDLDDFIDYLIAFFKKLGPDANVMAICQPAVPVLAAVSILSHESDTQSLPKSMILVGGPIDARKSPTHVNTFAEERAISWFEKHMITYVPVNYDGYLREVYPGFIQLLGFMSMNLYKHAGEHIKLFNHLVEGDGDSSEKHKDFYNEYLAVMDLPAEFYLQTIETVFHDFSLPEGKMLSRNRPVKPELIKKTALMCIEGELDDISGIGQTKAAIPLCKGLPDAKKHYYLQKGVGHYGTFNGRRFREHILPEIIKFTDKA